MIVRIYFLFSKRFIFWHSGNIPVVNKCLKMVCWEGFLLMSYIFACYMDQHNPYVFFGKKMLRENIYCIIIPGFHPRNHADSLKLFYQKLSVTDSKKEWLSFHVSHFDFVTWLNVLHKNQSNHTDQLLNQNFTKNEKE